MKRKVDLTETTKPNIWQWLSSSGNTIGNILKWGTAIGLLYAAVDLAHNINGALVMMRGDHEIIKTVPEKLNAIQRENEVRWEEQNRLDAEQNKNISNPELTRFMEEQQHTLNLVLEEIKKNNSLYYDQSMTMLNPPKQR